MSDTKIPVITFDVALKGIVVAIKDMGPNYVYQDSGVCKYVESDVDGYRSSCIVGHFLVNTLGISPEMFIMLDINQCHAVDSAMKALHSASIIEGLTEKAYCFLSAVQREQDSGQRWGNALVLGLAAVSHLPGLDDTVSYM